MYRYLANRDDRHVELFKQANERLDTKISELTENTSLYLPDRIRAAPCSAIITVGA